MNETPLSISVTDENGQLSFNQDKPRVNENSPIGTNVGRVVSFDPDNGEGLTLRLDDDSGKRFSLGTMTCQRVTSKPVRKSFIYYF